APAWPKTADGLAPWWTLPNWKVETGARIWLSAGSVGSPNPLLDTSGSLMPSRLTWRRETAYSGETFARADHASGWFGKGFIGAGRIVGGVLNDEDFLQSKNAYSNEYVPVNKGNLGYGAFDVGYNVLQSPGANVGLFVGYAYYHYHIDSHGCQQ